MSEAFERLGKSEEYKDNAERCLRRAGAENAEERREDS